MPDINQDLARKRCQDKLPSSIHNSIMKSIISATLSKQVKTQNVQMPEGSNVNVNLFFGGIFM